MNYIEVNYIEVPFNLNIYTALFLWMYAVKTLGSVFEASLDASDHIISKLLG